ncbi:MAG: UDP-N-acetylmuramoyl-tripeptide--D-alanyl-D-alanine ligase [Clostridiales bacterium]|nr:UDP-N-acetylmuramoyl-tripeptide--D-alanyl-D-alanine ligase [Clostridiales bacterium]
MLKLTLSEIAQAVNGKLNQTQYENLTITSVSTDSRSVTEGQLFVALKGDIFDGHEYIDKAYESGAVCVITQKGIITDKPYILVESTKYALLDLAAYYKGKFDIPVVAVTGSVGKTTTKDMIASVLSTGYNVLKNRGNFNNEIGLPLTVFEIEKGTEIAVLEMGMNSFGEIRNLSRVATPEVCVITNIGDAHIGLLGSRGNILKAKSEIFDFADKDCIPVLNGDDILLRTVDCYKGNTVFYGLSDNNDCKAKKLKDNGFNGTKWEVIYNGEILIIDIPFPGDYLIYNAMAAVCCGKIYDIKNEDIEGGIREFKPSQNRMDRFVTQSGIAVINDVYNSSPDSVKAMIGTFENVTGRKACILGDMLELGDKSQILHSDIGAFAAGKVALAVFIGKEAYNMYLAYNQSGGLGGFYYKDLEEFLRDGLDLLQSGDTVLVKASRGMRFEKIVNKLKVC